MSTNEQLYFVTENDGFFGQLRNPWESMDIDEIVTHLGSVKRVSWMQLANGEIEPRGAFILHSSSQQPEYKQYIDDILLHLLDMGNYLIPSVHTTRSHENKGYQELQKRKLGVRSLPATYFSKFAEIDLGKVTYPCVLKTLSGFGSGGVQLLRSEIDLRSATHPKPRRTVDELFRHVKSTSAYLVRKHLLRRDNLRPFGDYYDPHQRFILQGFVPDLQCDYKILTFQDRMFVAQRSVRSNDFRASGSGIVEFPQPPDGMLEFAQALLVKFAEPYMSFDIAFDGTSFHLIEFQGLHFGPRTLYEAPAHFQLVEETWKECTESISLEQAIGESLNSFLDQTV